MDPKIEQLFETLLSSLRKHFIERPFSIKDCGCSYREVMYWESKNLFPFSTTDHKWRKFNLTELTWLRLIARLRKFDVGVPFISEVKEKCFTLVSPNELLANPQEVMNFLRNIFGNDFKVPFEVIQRVAQDYFKVSQFEQWLLQMINRNQSLYLLIRRDKHTNTASVTPLFWNTEDQKENTQALLELMKDDRICIHVNQLFEDVLQLGDSKKIAAIFALDERETKILEILRNGTYKSVEIRFEDDRPKTVYAKEQLPVKNGLTLTNLIHRQGYHSITVKTENGTTVHIERTNITKL